MKVKLCWTGPYVVYKVHPHGALEIHNATDDTTFQVNDYRLKPYRESLSPEVEEILLEDLFYQD